MPWWEACALELGRQLQCRRRRLSLSVNAVAARLPVSGHAVHAYEQAGRSISVVRLYEICAVLRDRPSAVLAAVEDRVFGGPGALCLDLVVLARSEHPWLRPASAWARTTWRTAARQGLRSVVVSAFALAQLAVVCGVRRNDLLVALQAERATLPLCSDSRR
jgi:transcriptional regulator with XRE-family HTH domain